MKACSVCAIAHLSHVVSSPSKESDDESDDEERETAIDTAWGRSSSQYYAGDTADLEIGQDFQEAKEEVRFYSLSLIVVVFDSDYFQEEIARMMQAKRRKGEDESDYLILGEESSTSERGKASSSLSSSESGGLKRHGADVARLSPAERMALIERDSPELLGLLSEMKMKLDELSLLGLALDEAHTHASSRVTEKGLAYLELRHHLLLGYVMNVNMYLVLKAEASQRSGGGSAWAPDVRAHPVVDQLLRLQRALDKLKPFEKKGRKAVAALVQMAAEAVLEDDGDEDDGDEDDEEGEEGSEDGSASENDGLDDDEDSAEDGVRDSDGDSEEDEEEGSAPKAKKAYASEEHFNRRMAEAMAKSKGAPGKGPSKSERKKQAALLGSDVGDVERDGVVAAVASAKLQVGHPLMTNPFRPLSSIISRK